MQHLVLEFRHICVTICFIILVLWDLPWFCKHVIMMFSLANVCIQWPACCLRQSEPSLSLVEQRCDSEECEAQVLWLWLFNFSANTLPRFIDQSICWHCRAPHENLCHRNIASEPWDLQLMRLMESAVAGCCVTPLSRVKWGRKTRQGKNTSVFSLRGSARASCGKGGNEVSPLAWRHTHKHTLTHRHK